MRDGAHHPLTWRRATALVVSGVLFVYARASLWFHWILDELFFPGWRGQSVERPLFLVGNFRSGTTLLFRMVDRGEPATTAQATWEIYLAPSVSGRLLWRGLADLDRALGGAGARLASRANRALLNRVPYHPIDLFTPEEDAGGLMHVWAGFFTWFLFPRRGVVPEAAMVDLLPPRRRERAMGWYRAAVQKHLYARARHRAQAGGASTPGARSAAPIFVSKNPAFTGAVGALRDAFPGARCVTIVRDRDATHRSTMGWFGVWFALLGARATRRPDADLVWDLMRRWEAHAAAQRAYVVDYHELVASPREVLARLAHDLDLDWLRSPDALEAAVAELDRDHGSAQPVATKGDS